MKRRALRAYPASYIGGNSYVGVLPIYSQP